MKVVMTLLRVTEPPVRRFCECEMFYGQNRRIFCETVCTERFKFTVRVVSKLWRRGATRRLQLVRVAQREGCRWISHLPN
jgi:hypothetical protein